MSNNMSTQNHSHFGLWMAVYCLFMNSCVGCFDFNTDTKLRAVKRTLELSIEQEKRVLDSKIDSLESRISQLQRTVEEQKTTLRDQDLEIFRLKLKQR